MNSNRFGSAIAWASLLGAVCMAASVSSVAHADKNEAETCLRTKIWDGYNEGWAVRTAVSADLAEGAHRVYVVTLYQGNEYKFQVCGDTNAKDVDVVLHNAQGQELMRDRTDDREPLISFKPLETDTYYVAVYAAKVDRTAPTAGVSMAVTYR